MKIFTQTALAMLVGVAALFASLTTTMADTPKYKAPVTGTNLDKLTAHPKRHLVIETTLGTIKLQLFEKVAPGHVVQSFDQT